ncbi:MAG: hydroxymethylglutaryl-CoA synthase, partial [Thermoplasmata archaeon]|nr:hydroxymethylglutaryl-CoA synthase [Thermoplasmata archaeon]
GNTYSGAVLLGLAAILDVVNPGDRVFVIGYGSGAGSDGFDITINDEIENIRTDKCPAIMEMVENAAYIDYATYAKFRGKIRL